MKRPGLALLLSVSSSWLVSHQLFQSAQQVFTADDFDAAQYIRDSRQEVLAQEKDVRAFEQSLTAFPLENKSYFFDELSKEGVLVFRLSGVMVQRTSSFSSGMSTDRLGASFDRIISEHKVGIKDVKKVGLIWDSPGGDATPSFQLMEKFIELGQYIPTYSFNRGSMMSAACLVGLYASKGTYSSSFAHIGSIGAAVSLRSYAKQEKDEGIEVYVATSGYKKRLLSSTDEEGNLTKEAKEYADQIALGLGTTFQNHVWTARPKISDKDKANISEAGFFSAEEALTLGLIDGIKTENEFLDMLSSSDKTEDFGENTDDNGTEKLMTETQKAILALFGEDGKESLEDAQKAVLLSAKAVSLGFDSTSLTTDKEKVESALQLAEVAGSLNLDADKIKALASTSDTIKAGLIGDGLKYYSALSKNDEKSDLYLKKKAKLEGISSIEELTSEVEELRTMAQTNLGGSNKRLSTDDTDEKLTAYESVYGKDAN